MTLEDWNRFVTETQAEFDDAFGGLHQFVAELLHDWKRKQNAGH
jgi:hypothetical protein